VTQHPRTVQALQLDETQFHKPVHTFGTLSYGGVTSEQGPNEIKHFHPVHASSIHGGAFLSADSLWPYTGTAFSWWHLFITFPFSVVTSVALAYKVQLGYMVLV